MTHAIDQGHSRLILERKNAEGFRNLNCGTPYLMPKFSVPDHHEKQSGVFRCASLESSHQGKRLFHSFKFSSEQHHHAIVSDLKFAPPPVGFLLQGVIRLSETLNFDRMRAVEEPRLRHAKFSEVIGVVLTDVETAIRPAVDTAQQGQFDPPANAI